MRKSNHQTGTYKVDRQMFGKNSVRMIVFPTIIDS